MLAAPFTFAGRKQLVSFPFPFQTQNPRGPTLVMLLFSTPFFLLTRGAALPMLTNQPSFDGGIGTEQVHTYSTKLRKSHRRNSFSPVRGS